MTGPELVALRPTAMAAGGEAVARQASGRVVFVRGALPGEAVVARMVEERDRYARAVVERVEEASPGRVEPPCPYVAAGCGGCSWQHIAPAEQRALKHQIAEDALTRAGGVAGAVIVDGPDLPTDGFRTTVRLAVTNGRAGYRRLHSHEVVLVDSCLVAHPALASLIADARFPGAEEVVLRCSAATGERLVRVLPEDAAAAADLPTDVVRDPDAWLTEDVAGRPLRVSARSFFQTRPDGAAALVATVMQAAGDELGRGTVVDAYAGVGLFSACLPVTGRVVAVERSKSSCRDAAVNLVHRDATIVRVDVARWRPEPAALVIADPPRTGLGAAAADRLARTDAARIVLVSCDPASMGRDVALLAGRGYRHVGTTLVDLFPHTPHLEAVTTLLRE
jgi:23S rRNA (uracil1939-C5)-methyltransferase